MTLTQDQRGALEEEDRRNGSGPQAPSWPDPLRRVAYHGLAGRVVRAIEPHSEADPVAVLVSFMVGFGNAAGHGAGFRAEADFHPTTLNAILAGATSKGRKGSSSGQANKPLKRADPTWEARIVSGLSSGEGLIHAVRDSVVTRRRARTKEERSQADPDGYIEEISDEGVEDKRLLVQESEFASALRVMSRDGSTLSAVMRQAWDGGTLRTLTRNAALTATDAHISVVGHISRDELRRELSDTDAASGFFNRFLPVCVRRSKVLPEGGDIEAIDWQPIINAIAAALSFARRTGELRRNAEARQLWARVYPELSEGQPGLLGAATSRAEAQVMRLAVIYALLDQKEEVGVEHLEAALAVWDYSFASARFIFGDALGDPLADEIRMLLRQAGVRGLTRNEIREHFGRHKRSEEISGALAVLAERGLAGCQSEETGGRPAERWALTAHSALTAQPQQPEAGDDESSGSGGLGGAVNAISAERPEIEDHGGDPFADVDPDPRAPALPTDGRGGSK
jgi:hypothetical protein